jgi:hypothetical protein
MVSVLIDALGISPDGLVSTQDWLQRVRWFEGSVLENVAAKMVDFLSQDFEHMSCGGVLLETSKTQQHSQTL